MNDKEHDSRARIMSQLELLPQGWYVELIPKMVDELVQALGSHVNDFKIHQCKEKYGYLRVYWHLAQNVETITRLEVASIIQKYESMSAKICANCGAPATHTTEPWILYMCDSCNKEII